MITPHPSPGTKAKAFVMALAIGSAFGFVPTVAKDKVFESEVRVSKENGLITTIFHTPSGGKVIAFLPLNAQADEAEIGGTVERQMPPLRPGQGQDSAEAANEIAGVVRIEPKRKSGASPISSVPGTAHFTCAPTDSAQYDISYKPTSGSACKATVKCPLVAPLPTAGNNVCSIPQLTSKNGNLHISMPGNGNDPGQNTCIIGGQPADCRAWSKEGAVFHVPSVSQLVPGPNSVVVARGNEMAIGQTHVAQVTMSCVPNNLKQGEPCEVTTSVHCPGLKDVAGGTLNITNYNPSVLHMADKIVPIPSDPDSHSPSTSELLKRDTLRAANNLQRKLSDSPQAGTPEAGKLKDAIQQVQNKCNQ